MKSHLRECYLINTEIALYTELECLYGDKGATEVNAQAYMADGIGLDEVRGAHT